MKKFFLLSLQLLMILFISCDDEPVDEELLNQGNVECITATESTLSAQTIFNNASEENYTALCNAYKNTIEHQIQVCGDTSGVLQQIIDNLGDCLASNPCIEATNITTQASIAFNEATDSNYTELCNGLVLALESQIEACGDTNGSLQTQINNLGDCTQDNPCTDAIAATTEAQNNFNNATEANYTELCNALVMALETQIAVCGDENGTLQAQIDNLGDCTQNNACTDATTTTTNAQNAFNNATDNNYTQLCNDLVTALTAQIQACGDTDGSLQNQIDNLGDCTQADPCADAANDTANAQTAFDNATDNNYTELCNALVAALQAQIQACGDDNGELQVQIDNLGDCTPNNQNASFISFTYNGNPYYFEEFSYEIQNGWYIITVNDTESNDFAFLNIQQNVTGTDVIGYLELNLNGTAYTQAFGGSDDIYTDTVTVNDGTSIVATFTGAFIANSIIQITDGNINFIL